MSVFAAPDEFVYIVTIGKRKAKDPDIPGICVEYGFQTLITVNVKDFGARRAIYEKVVESGINVLVMRCKPRQKTSINWQAGLLTLRYPTYSKLFNERQPDDPAILAVLTEGGVRAAKFDELIEQMRADAGGVRHLP